MNYQHGKFTKGTIYTSNPPETVNRSGIFHTGQGQGKGQGPYHPGPAMCSPDFQMSPDAVSTNPKFSRAEWTPQSVGAYTHIPPLCSVPLLYSSPAIIDVPPNNIPLDLTVCRQNLRVQRHAVCDSVVDLTVNSNIISGKGGISSKSEAEIGPMRNNLSFYTTKEVLPLIGTVGIAKSAGAKKTKRAKRAGKTKSVKKSIIESPSRRTRSQTEKLKFESSSCLTPTRTMEAVEGLLMLPQSSSPSAAGAVVSATVAEMAVTKLSKVPRKSLRPMKYRLLDYLNQAENVDQASSSSSVLSGLAGNKDIGFAVSGPGDASVSSKTVLATEKDITRGGGFAETSLGSSLLGSVSGQNHHQSTASCIVVTATETQTSPAKGGTVLSCATPFGAEKLSTSFDIRMTETPIHLMEICCQTDDNGMISKSPAQNSPPDNCLAVKDLGVAASVSKLCFPSPAAVSFDEQVASLSNLDLHQMKQLMFCLYQRIEAQEKMASGESGEKEFISITLPESELLFNSTDQVSAEHSGTPPLKETEHLTSEVVVGLRSDNSALENTGVLEPVSKGYDPIPTCENKGFEVAESGIVAVQTYTDGKNKNLEQPLIESSNSAGPRTDCVDSSFTSEQPSSVTIVKVQPVEGLVLRSEISVERKKMVEPLIGNGVEALESTIAVSEESSDSSEVNQVAPLDAAKRENQSCIQLEMTSPFPSVTADGKNESGIMENSDGRIDDTDDVVCVHVTIRNEVTALELPMSDNIPDRRNDRRLRMTPVKVNQTTDVVADAAFRTNDNIVAITKDDDESVIQENDVVCRRIPDGIDRKKTKKRKPVGKSGTHIEELKFSSQSVTSPGNKVVTKVTAPCTTSLSKIDVSLRTVDGTEPTDKQRPATRTNGSPMKNTAANSAPSPEAPILLFTKVTPEAASTTKELQSVDEQNSGEIKCESNETVFRTPRSKILLLGADQLEQKVQVFCDLVSEDFDSLLNARVVVKRLEHGSSPERKQDAPDYKSTVLRWLKKPRKMKRRRRRTKQKTQKHFHIDHSYVQSISGSISPAVDRKVSRQKNVEPVFVQQKSDNFSASDRPDDFELMAAVSSSLNSGSKEIENEFLPPVDAVNAIVNNSPSLREDGSSFQENSTINADTQAEIYSASEKEVAAAESKVSRIDSLGERRKSGDANRLVAVPNVFDHIGSHLGRPSNLTTDAPSRESSAVGNRGPSEPSEVSKSRDVKFANSSKMLDKFVKKLKTIGGKVKNLTETKEPIEPKESETSPCFEPFADSCSNSFHDELDTNERNAETTPVHVSNIKLNRKKFAGDVGRRGAKFLPTVDQSDLGGGKAAAVETGRVYLKRAAFDLANWFLTESRSSLRREEETREKIVDFGDANSSNSSRKLQHQQVGLDTKSPKKKSSPMRSTKTNIRDNRLSTKERQSTDITDPVQNDYHEDLESGGHSVEPLTDAIASSGSSHRRRGRKPKQSPQKSKIVEDSRRSFGQTPASDSTELISVEHENEDGDISVLTPQNVPDKGQKLMAAPLVDDSTPSCKILKFVDTDLEQSKRKDSGIRRIETSKSSPRKGSKRPNSASFYAADDDDDEILTSSCGKTKRMKTDKSKVSGKMKESLKTAQKSETQTQANVHRDSVAKDLNSSTHSAAVDGCCFGADRETIQEMISPNLTVRRRGRPPKNQKLSNNVPKTPDAEQVSQQKSHKKRSFESDDSATTPPKSRDAAQRKSVDTPKSGPAERRSVPSLCRSNAKRTTLSPSCAENAAADTDKMYTTPEIPLRKSTNLIQDIAVRKMQMNLSEGANIVVDMVSRVVSGETRFLQCLFCEFLVPNITDVIEHMDEAHTDVLFALSKVRPAQDGAIRYFCRHCQFVTLDSTVMWIHFEMMHDSVGILASQNQRDPDRSAPESDDQPISLDQSVHFDRVHMCAECGHLLVDQKAMVAHVTQCHAADSYFNGHFIKSIVLSNPRGLSEKPTYRALIMDDKYGVYRKPCYICVFCRFVVYDARLALSHFIGMHVEKKLLMVCTREFCGQRFVKERQFQEHVRQSHGASTIGMHFDCSVTLLERSESGEIAEVAFSNSLCHQ